MAWNGTTREKYRRGSDRYESDLTDGEWRVTEPPLPAPLKPGRRRTVGLRNHFRAWRDDGVLERMTDALRDLARERAGRSASPAAAATGSRSVRTTEPGGPSGYDAGKRTTSGKRHAVVDVEGFPIAIQVHAADVRDRDGAGR